MDPKDLPQPELDLNFVPKTDDLITIRELTARRMEAEFKALGARHEAQASLNRSAEAEVQIGIAKAELHHENQRNRPCFALRAELIYNDDDKWVAQLGALYVDGDTPEQAFANFDLVWLYGHPPDEAEEK